MPKLQLPKLSARFSVAPSEGLDASFRIVYRLHLRVPATAIYRQACVITSRQADRLTWDLGIPGLERWDGPGGVRSRESLKPRARFSGGVSEQQLPFASIADTAAADVTSTARLIPHSSL